MTYREMVRLMESTEFRQAWALGWALPPPSCVSPSNSHTPPLMALHRPGLLPAPDRWRERELCELSVMFHKFAANPCCLHLSVREGRASTWGPASRRRGSVCNTGRSGWVMSDKILYLPALGFLTSELAGQR